MKKCKLLLMLTFHSIIRCMAHVKFEHLKIWLVNDHDRYMQYVVLAENETQARQSCGIASYTKCDLIEINEDNYDRCWYKKGLPYVLTAYPTMQE